MNSSQGKDTVICGSVGRVRKQSITGMPQNKVCGRLCYFLSQAIELAVDQSNTIKSNKTRLCVFKKIRCSFQLTGGGGADYHSVSHIGAISSYLETNTFFTYFSQLLLVFLVADLSGPYKWKRKLLNY